MTDHEPTDHEPTDHEPTDREPTNQQSTGHDDPRLDETEGDEGMPGEVIDSARNMPGDQPENDTPPSRTRATRTD